MSERPDEWFFVEDGRQTGPVPFEELRARAVRGDLERPHLVWAEGLPDWQAAETVEGLFEGVEVSPTVSPPTWRPDVAPPPSASTGGVPGLVIGGFVCSIAGLVVCTPVSVVGLILSLAGLSQSKKRGGAGKGLAIAGIVLGIMGVLLLVIVAVMIVVGIAASSGGGF